MNKAFGSPIKSTCGIHHCVVVMRGVGQIFGLSTSLAPSQRDYPCQIDTLADHETDGLARWFGQPG